VADLKERFGKHLAEYRKRRGLTQEGLASKAQVSIDTVKRLETGKLGASFDVVVQLSEALNVDAGMLFVSFDDQSRPVFDRLVFALSEMSDDELLWLQALVDLASRRPGVPAGD
jgi:transcriptional regulator with XRE-family HTH domain